MKKLSIHILLAFFTAVCARGQSIEHPTKEQLEEYHSYSYKFESESCWKYQFVIVNGLVVKQKNYCVNKLRYEAEFIYDQHGNVVKEVQVLRIQNGNRPDTISYTLKYDGSKLIQKKSDSGLTENYLEFSELNKPRIIERTEISQLSSLSSREVLEYDTRGNIIRSTEISLFQVAQEKATYEKTITSFKYDSHNNVTEIHREFDPKREFPIPITGGPSLYEIEYFRYKYNKKGLWTKKYKTVEGREKLIAKRRFI